MRQIRLPAGEPMTLVTTVRTTWPADESLLLDIHLPDRDIRLCFGDTAVAAAFRRALHSLLTDAGRLTDEDGILSRVVTPRDPRRTPTQLALF